MNEKQREAVEHIQGPLLIVAGAGTGKTRVIVEKVGYLLRNVPGLEPENILALTFSEKAAGGMKQRAAERFGEAGHRCRFSTFHAFCYQLLSEQFPWKAMEEVDHWIFLRRRMERLELDYYLRVSEPGRFLDDLLEFCSRCHDNLVTPADYSAYVEKLPSDSLDASRLGRRPKEPAEQEIARQREVARVFARSEELQEEAGLLSFGAMISRAVALLQNSPDLLDRLQRRYRFILVDEFQDTNWGQIELLRLLAGKSQNLKVVGDRKQAIYHFRGASHASFILFEKTFPDPARVVLSENYRSSQRILAVAEAAISSSAREHSQPEEPLRTSNSLGRKVEVWEFADEYQQAEFLAGEISQRVKAGEAKAYSEFAVLYRAHRYRNRLVAALRRHRIPFAIRNLAINNLPPVRDMVAYLRAIGCPGDSVSLLRVMTDPHWKIETALLLKGCRTAHGRRLALREIINTNQSRDPGPAGAEAREEPALSLPKGASTERRRVPPSKASEVVDGIWKGQSSGNGAEMAKLVDFLGRYQKIAQEQRIGAWLNQLRQELGLFGRPEENPAWKAFSEFVLRWDREKSSSGLLKEFLEYFAYFEEAHGTITLPDEEAGVPVGGDAPKDVASGRGAGSQPRQGSLWEEPAAPEPLGKVQLMTVHAAKGLEFENVFVLHLLRGAFPTSYRRPLISFPTDLLAERQIVQTPRGDLYLEEEQRDLHLKEERRLFYVALTRARSTLTLCTISNDRQKPSVFLEELRKNNCPELEWKKLAPLPVPPETDASRQGASFVVPRLARLLECPTGAERAADSLILSVSGLETYLECPLKYRYSYVWQVPVSPSPALVFGSIMHGAIKQVVNTLAHRPEDMNAETIEAIFKEHWSPAGFSDPLQARKYWEMGRQQLEGFWSRIAGSARPFELLSQEKTFEFVCGGTKVVGRIDQINRIEKKNVELIEYKTGRALTQKEADRSRQLTVYALACREVLGLEPVAVVLYNLAAQEGLRTQRNPEDFRILEEEFRQTNTNILAGKFPPLPGYHCRYCDFRPICPAHEDSSRATEDLPNV